MHIVKNLKLLITWMTFLADEVIKPYRPIGRHATWIRSRLWRYFGLTSQWQKCFYISFPNRTTKITYNASRSTFPLNSKECTMHLIFRIWKPFLVLVKIFDLMANPAAHPHIPIVSGVLSNGPRVFQVVHHLLFVAWTCDTF